MSNKRSAAFTEYDVDPADLAGQTHAISHYFNMIKCHEANKAEGLYLGTPTTASSQVTGAGNTSWNLNLSAGIVTVGAVAKEYAAQADFAVHSGSLLTGLIDQSLSKAGLAQTEAKTGLLASIDNAGLDGDFTNQVAVGGAYEIVSDAAGDTTQSVTVYGTDAADAAQEETLTLTGVAPVVSGLLWNSIHGVIIDAAPAGTVTVQRSGGGLAITTLTALALSKGLYALTDVINDSTLMVFADGASTKKLSIIGLDAGGAGQTEVVTLAGATEQLTTGAWSALTYLAAGEVEAARTVSLVPDLAANVTPGGAYEFVSDAAGDTTQTLTVYGTDAADAAQVETLSLNGVVTVTSLLTWNSIHAVVLDSAPAGTVTIQDSPAGAVLTKLSAAALTKGRYVLTNTVNNAPLSLVASGASTAKITVIGLDHAAAAAREVVTLNGTTPVQTTTKWSSLAALCVAELAVTLTVTAYPDLIGQVVAGSTFELSSSAAGDTTQTVTVYGTDATDAAQSEELAVNGVAVVPSTKTWNSIHGLVIDAAPAGVIGVARVGAGALIAELTPTGLSRGLYAMSALAINDTKIGFTADGASTAKITVVGLDAAGADQIETVTLSGATEVQTVNAWSQVDYLAFGELTNARTVAVVSSGKSVTAALVAKNVAGTISIVSVKGAAAATGSQRAPTTSEINAAVGASNSWVQIGEATINRVGDTTITQSQTSLMRPILGVTVDPQFAAFSG